eukprot:CAMPEP_0118878164 /NCGR_PEP_ID=MMETSP1163-20130328/18183_1 /TAXON_ID=124430 /ORGANISM="Phaeomonas parva, Strain CCMP2877" /LENGTH=186 /DNA_ID=CAMNT_0006813963 /DNA_START=51 /DNA_END=607 /DNA_ORIENTATION=+
MAQRRSRPRSAPGYRSLGKPWRRPWEESDEYIRERRSKEREELHRFQRQCMEKIKQEKEGTMKKVAIASHWSRSLGLGQHYVARKASDVPREETTTLRRLRQLPPRYSGIFVEVFDEEDLKRGLAPTQIITEALFLREYEKIEAHVHRHGLQAVTEDVENSYTQGGKISEPAFDPLGKGAHGSPAP